MFVDDATSRLMELRFVASESTFAYFAALKAYLGRHPEYDGPHAGRRQFLSTGFFTEALPLIEKFWGDKVPFVQA